MVVASHWHKHVAAASEHWYITGSAARVCCLMQPSSGAPLISPTLVSVQHACRSVTCAAWLAAAAVCSGPPAPVNRLHAAVLNLATSSEQKPQTQQGVQDHIPEARSQGLSGLSRCNARELNKRSGCRIPTPRAGWPAPRSRELRARLQQLPSSRRGLLGRRSSPPWSTGWSGRAPLPSPQLSRYS